MNRTSCSAYPDFLFRSYSDPKIFEEHWAVIERLLQEKRPVGSSPFGELTGFLRHYLAACTGNLYNREHIYARFRDRIRREFPEPKAFIAEIIKLRHFAEYYDRLLRPEHEPNRSIAAILGRLETFEMSTAFPFLLRAYEAHDSKRMSDAQFISLLNTVENYAVRRFLCGKQANFLNTMFPTLWEEIDFDQFPDSLHTLLATKQYPTDQDVRNAIRFGKLYTRNQQRLDLILTSINRSLSRDSDAYTVLGGLATLEHVLPQSRSPAWEAELGEGWPEVYREQLHTLGNLTLVTQSWNSSLSNAPFAEKRERLAESGLRLNSEYFGKEIERWDREAILARADWIADKVLEAWPSLDTPPYIDHTTGIRPVAVTILGTRYPVKTWREVMYRTAETVAEWLGSAFPPFAERYPKLFSQQPSPHRPRQLSNGWWVYLNLSRASVLKYSRQIVVAAKIPEPEWHVEEVDTAEAPVGRTIIARSGRQVDPSDIDTIVVPARKEGFEITALGEQRWYAVSIHGSLIPKIKYLAVYRVAPVSAITHIAAVQSIEPWESSPGKYVLNFAEPLEPIEPIRLVPHGKVKAPQSLRYTAHNRLVHNQETSS